MDKFNRKWIIANAVEEIANYPAGMLTVRGLHYRLVARGMTNTTRHYKRVVNAMIQARWDGTVSFDTFSDNDREVIGYTSADVTNLEESIETAEHQIKLWMESYGKNKWENQPIYPEVFIEKKALQGVFSSVCQKAGVALSACKGYPSLTFLHEASIRFQDRILEGKKVVILYFGDYDPSGEDIPRSIEENLYKMGADVEVKRVSLLEEQVVNWNLPPAPVKPGDSRSASWDGLGQVELDAVEPNVLQKMCEDSIDDLLDMDLLNDLRDKEREEGEAYVEQLKKFVKTL